jgi:excisionase family DNA binding protein
VRHELETLLSLSRSLNRDELIPFLAEIETIRLEAMMRLTAPASQTQPDSLLTVDEAAQRLHCSADWLYRHHRKLAFARRIGSKLLFSSNGIDKYIERRAAK